MSKTTEQELGMSVQEMFQSSVINKGGFGLDCYRVPPTSLRLKKGITFPQSKLKDQSDPNPCPTKYSPTDASMQKRFWNSSMKIPKAHKETIISEIMNHGKNTPGPNKYSPKSSTTHGVSFGKAVGINYMSNVIREAEERPEFCSYSPQMNQIFKSQPAWKVGKSKSTRLITKKTKIGPGSYDIGAAFFNTLPDKKSFTMFKAAKTLVSHQSGSPGIGTYELAVKGKDLTLKKDRVASIYPYKIMRYIDGYIKDKEALPGPGSYEIY